MSTIRIEVVYALPDEQQVAALELDAGSTVRDAIEASGLPRRPLRSDRPNQGMVGIFGRLVTLDTVLEHGDRVEIYRSLEADPKDARRKRALVRR